MTPRIREPGKPGRMATRAAIGMASTHTPSRGTHGPPGIVLVGADASPAGEGRRNRASGRRGLAH